MRLPSPKSGTRESSAPGRMTAGLDDFYFWDVPPVPAKTVRKLRIRKNQLPTEMKLMHMRSVLTRNQLKAKRGFPCDEALQPPEMGWN